MNPQWLCLCQGCLFQTMSPQCSSFEMLPPRSHSEASHMSQQTNACTTSGSTHPHQLQDFKRTFTREDHEKYWTLADKRPSMCMFQGQGVMRGGGVFWILSDQGTFEFISSSSSSFCIKIVPVQLFFSYKSSWEQWKHPSPQNVGAEYLNLLAALSVLLSMNMPTPRPTPWPPLWPNSWLTYNDWPQDWPHGRQSHGWPHG